MANFSAADVKKLRDATGAGMMECKKALEEADGDYQRAVEILRVKGTAKDEKRAGTRGRERPGRRRRGRDDRARVRDRLRRQERPVPDARRRHRRPLRGLVRRPTSRRCAARPCRTARPSRRTSATSPPSSARSSSCAAPSSSTARWRPTCTRSPRTCRRRWASWCSSPARTTQAARGAAMQVAALRAKYLTREDVPAEAVEAERRVAEEKARAEGKPEQAIAKIVEGRGQRLLHGQRPARAGVGAGDQEERQAGPRRGRRDPHRVRPLRGRLTRRPTPAALPWRAPVRIGFATTCTSTRGAAMTDTEAAPPSYRRVLLKLSGEVFGGGAIGVDPDVVASIARQIAEVVAERRPGRDRRRRRQLLPRRRAQPARHGPGPRRLHGHARHRA